MNVSFEKGKLVCTIVQISSRFSLQILFCLPFHLTVMIQYIFQPTFPHSSGTDILLMHPMKLNDHEKQVCLYYAVSVDGSYEVV